MQSFANDLESKDHSIHHMRSLALALEHDLKDKQDYVDLLKQEL